MIFHQVKTGIEEEKSLCRSYFKLQASWHAPEIPELSVSLKKHLADFEVYREAPVMAGFVPVKGEPALRGVLQEWLDSGRKLLLPAYDKDWKVYSLASVEGLDGNFLAPGLHGIPEPLPSLHRLYPPYTQKNMLWLIPGMAFTPAGMRLGRGGGFYDRLLEMCAGVKVGVCFNFQLADYLPAGEYDVRMDFLLTETGIVNCKEHSALAAGERIRVKNV